MEIRTNGAEPFILANKPHLFVTVLAERTLKAHLHHAPLQPGTRFSPVLFFHVSLSSFFANFPANLSLASFSSCVHQVPVSTFSFEPIISTEKDPIVTCNI